MVYGRINIWLRVDSWGNNLVHCMDIDYAHKFNTERLCLLSPYCHWKQLRPSVLPYIHEAIALTMDLLSGLQDVDGNRPDDKPTNEISLLHSAAAFASAEKLKVMVSIRFGGVYYKFRAHLTKDISLYFQWNGQRSYCFMHNCVMISATKFWRQQTE